MDLNEQFKDLRDEIKKVQLQSKTVLNVDELSEYTGYSKDHIYRMISLKELPCYRPSGRKLFFLKNNIDSWLTGKVMAKT
tara:strand:+ start:397 stop:636 length:240 start_codon:yes stop_codon:yes gene_type:complete